MHQGFLSLVAGGGGAPGRKARPPELCGEAARHPELGKGGGGTV